MRSITIMIIIIAMATSLPGCAPRDHDADYWGRVAVGSGEVVK